MARREFSRKTKRDGFLRAEGRCEAILPDGTRCNAKLTVGKMTYDHVIPDQMGGEPDLANLQVICRPCDIAKTRADQGDIAKAKRREDDHRGIRPASTLKGQGFRKFAPQRSATRSVPKLEILFQRDRQS